MNRFDLKLHQSHANCVIIAKAMWPKKTTPKVAVSIQRTVHSLNYNKNNPMPDFPKWLEWLSMTVECMNDNKKVNELLNFLNIKKTVRV